MEISNLWTMWQIVSLLGPSLVWSYTGQTRDADSPGMPDSLLLTKAVGGPGPAASIPCLLSSQMALLLCREVLGRSRSFNVNSLLLK